MPLTPFHLAYPWLIKLKAKSLDFAGLTVGSIAPDVEVPIYFFLGLGRADYIAHSIIGALTVSVLFSIILAFVLSKLRVERFGLSGFQKIRITHNFLFSAAIGSLTHLAADYTNHTINPLFWPAPAIPSLFVQTFGLVLPTIFIHLLSLSIIIFIIHKKLKLQNLGFSYMLSHPIAALRIATKSLSG